MPWSKSSTKNITPRPPSFPSAWSGRENKKPRPWILRTRTATPPSCSPGRRRCGDGRKSLKAVIVDETGPCPSNWPTRTPSGIPSRIGFSSAYGPDDQLFSAYGSSCSSAMLRSIAPWCHFGNDPLDVQKISGQGIDAINKERGGKMDACMPGCIVKCSVIFNDLDGKYLTASYEYEATAMIGTNLGINDPTLLQSMTESAMKSE